MADRKLILQGSNGHRSVASPRSPRITSSKSGKMMLAISRKSCQLVSDPDEASMRSAKDRLQSLDEDTYSSDLQAIISRDYFSADQTDKETPKMSLDEYQARYTSEDNRDFSNLAEKQNKELRKRAPWLYGESRLITSGTSSQKMLDNSSSKSISSGRNALMFSPESSVSYKTGSAKRILQHNTQAPRSQKPSTRTSRAFQESKTYNFVSSSRDSHKIQKKPLTPAAKRMLERVQKQ